MLLILFFSISLAQAQTYSRLLPLFQEAIRTLDDKTTVHSGTLNVIHRFLAREQWSPQWPQSQLLLPPKLFPVPIVGASSKTQWPAVSLQIARMDVLRASDDWFKDDLYCYFFITDGVIPSGKVTQVYQGLSEGESFHFIPADRALYPLVDGSRIPSGQLIIDYGIIESDGDDIRQLHRLTEIIAELAFAVYSVLEPTEALQWGSLRQEIVALTQALTNLNHDDRMATGSIVLTADEAHRLWNGASVASIERKHQNNHFFDKWRYRLIWRLIKD